jgi:hypothetical protein
MEAVSFSPFDASRIANAVKRVERYAGTTATGEPVPWNDGGNEVLFGTAAADWTSGNTISLTPCDSEGTATGEAALDVACPWGDGNTVALAIVGGTADVAVGCTISQNTILQYAYAADGTPTLIGVPPTELEYIRYDSATSHNLQLRVRFLFGTGRSTFSDWIDLMTSEESKKVSCDTPGS